MLSIILEFLIKPIWKYLKDSILGDKSFKAAWRTEKKRLALFVVITFSVSLNVFLVPRVITITEDYISITKKYKDYQKKLPLNCKKEISEIIYTAPTNLVDKIS